VSGVDRIRRQQVLREAEGYLDLVSLFEGEWSPSAVSTARLANRCLDVLDRLPSNVAAGGPASFLRGQALRLLGRYSDAIAPLREAADSEPSDIESRLALGWCYKRSGKLSLAIESLEEALAIDASQAIVHYNLACYWSLAQHLDHALRYLSQALTMDEKYRLLIESESDFDPIRSDPGFQSLIGMIV